MLKCLIPKKERKTTSNSSTDGVELISDSDGETASIGASSASSYVNMPWTDINFVAALRSMSHGFKRLGIEVTAAAMEELLE